MSLRDVFTGKKLNQIKDDQLKNVVILMAKEVSSQSDLPPLQEQSKLQLLEAQAIQ